MADGAHQEKPISLFYSYCHRDEELRKKLEDHLAGLRRSEMIAEWHDRNIDVGDEWAKEIDRNLSSADVILLLVSANFIASEYCWSVEMKKALERHDKGQAKVIPVILRPCSWHTTPFAKLQAVPTDAKPVTSWSDPDEALYDVACKIERAVTDLQQQRRRADEARRAADAEARREPSRAKAIEDFTVFRPDSATAPQQHQCIHCPYCNHYFSIASPTEHTTAPSEPIIALPYARDVEIFDPDPDSRGNTNSEWTTIGKDFFGGMNYESIGILHMEKTWRVLYCVARCPRCSRLIDVFANLTAGKRLADMWPHLLGKGADGTITRWRPKGTLSSWSEDTFYVILFFLVIGAVSLLPDLMSYFRNPVFIGLFQNEEALSRLFKIQTGLAYWSNFAVSRFTGYQRENHLFTVNAVMLLGGVSSIIILTAAWMIVQFRMAPPPETDPYATATAFLFWFIVAYLFGIVVWNFSVVPVYIFRGMRNIPMRMDIDGEFRESRLIRRAARYCITGLGILIVSAIALSLFPIFTAPFAELRSAIIWAQFALIVCFFVLIIRFEIKAEKDRAKKIKGIVKIILILLAYVLLRYGIGISQADGVVIQTIGWLGIVESDAAKRYAELVIFSFLAAYLFYRLTRDIMLGQIKESTQYNIFRDYDDEVAKARERKDYAAEASIRAAAPPAASRDRHEKTVERRLQWATVIFGFLGPIAALLIEHIFLDG